MIVAVGVDRDFVVGLVCEGEHAIVLVDFEVTTVGTSETPLDSGVRVLGIDRSIGGHRCGSVLAVVDLLKSRNDLWRFVEVFDANCDNEPARLAGFVVRLNSNNVLVVVVGVGRYFVVGLVLEGEHAIVLVDFEVTSVGTSEAPLDFGVRVLGIECCVCRHGSRSVFAVGRRVESGDVGRFIDLNDGHDDMESPGVGAVRCFYIKVVLVVAVGVGWFFVVGLVLEGEHTVGVDLEVSAVLTRNAECDRRCAVWIGCPETCDGSRPGFEIVDFLVA